MRINTSTQWILALLLFFTSNFVTQAQTLDATFSSPLTNQCAGSLFTLNATTTTYQGYSWTIEGPNNFSNTSTGTISALYLTEPGTYNVSLSVTDGVITTNNSVSGYLNVGTPAIANAGVDQTICSNSSVTLNGSVGGSATSISWSGGTGTFSPNIANLTATYTPSPSEIAIGFVNLVLTTNDPAGPCAADRDTVMILFNSLPTVSAPTSLCVGSTAQLSPSSGGIWTSSNSTIATISAISGLATGVSPGNVTFTFTSNATSCSNSTSNIAVNPLPTVSAPASICEGSTGQLSPSTGGTWISNIITIATVTNSGVVTPVSPGFVTFTYVNTVTGCSATSSPVEVYGLQQVSMPTSILCVNSTMQLSPNSGGTWVSSNPSIASITNVGLVTGLATGTVNFTFTNSTTGCVRTTNNLTVSPLPTFTLSKSDPTTCNGTNGTINILGLTPNVSYQYSYVLSNISNGPITTTSNSSGQITIFGLSAGTYTLSILHPASGCQSATQAITLVNPNAPYINDIQDQVLCGTTYSLPAITGTNLPGNQAYYTGPNGTGSVISTGTVISSTSTIYMYTSTIGGCIDEESFTVTIHSQPTVSAPASICVGSTAQLSPSSGGAWTSNMPVIAVVNNNGIATGQAAGFVTFTYVNTVTGCSATSSPVEVYGIQQVSMPNSQLCINSTMQLSPNSGGTWVSSNPSIASITNNGLVTGLASGTVNFTFTNSTTGCARTTNNLTVNPLPIITLSSNSVCVNSSIQITSSNQGSSINISNPIVASYGSNGITGNAEGTFFITIVSPIGCTNTSEQITVTENATINPIPDQIICAGDSTTPITFSGSAQQYNWTNDNTSIGLAPSGTGNIAGFIATNPTATNQIATITVTPINGSCNSTPTTFTITVKPMPTVDMPQNQTRCHNDSTLTINFSGAINGTDYNWTNSNSSIGCAASGTGDIPSFQVQNTTFGSQIANFVVTPSLNGCIGVVDTFSITVNPLPLFNAGNDTILCLGESFTPTASGTFSLIAWNNGVFDGTPFTPTVTETYIATVTDMNCSNSDSITITVNSVPQLTISTFDGEDSLACDGTLSVLVTDGTAPYSYTWTNGATNYTTPAIQDLCSGTYALSVVDANGCSATNSAVINDTLIPVIVGDTLIFTDNIYQDSTIIGADTSDWIENCTFDYDLVTSATISSYVDNGSSTIVTWLISLSDGSTIPIEATYNLSPGTAGVYDLTLQLTCSQKSDPKFLVANSRLYYEGSTIGIQSNSLSVVHLYPNPAKSTLSISGINESFQFEIRDIQGKLLKQGANEKQIEIENLPVGTYVIGISTDSEVRQLRFVKL